MRSAFAALYSAAVYLFFLGTFTYAIFWVEGILVPTTIDSGVAAIRSCRW